MYTRLYDVIVIGAGISGLAAAKALKRSGKQVLVLEARDRLGGRLHTDRHFGIPIDLGGSWAHDLKNNLLVNEGRLSFDLLPFDDLLLQLKTHMAYDETGEKIAPNDLECISQCAQAFFSHLMHETTRCDVSDFLDQFENSTLPSKNLARMKTWLKKLLPCWSGAELKETSVEVWRLMEEESGNAYVLNGYDTLINELALDIDVCLETPVSQVNYVGNNVCVYSHETMYHAKVAILTLPIGVLKAGVCQFFPELPAKKIKAINTIGSGLLNKAVLKFPHCFWDEAPLTIHYLNNDTNVAPVYINYHAMMKKPILVAMYGGQQANDMEEKSQKYQRKALLEPLQLIYDDHYIEPEEIMTTTWHADPYSRGAYAYLPKGGNDNCFDLLAKPVCHRLFFAGEATNKKAYASVHGAYASGLRAANEVFTVLKTL